MATSTQTCGDVLGEKLGLGSCFFTHPAGSPYSCSVAYDGPVSVRLLLLPQITQIFGDTLGSPRLLGGVEGNLLRGLCSESLSY